MGISVGAGETLGSRKHQGFFLLDESDMQHCTNLRCIVCAALMDLYIVIWLSL